MEEKDCLLCRIAAGTEPAVKVGETEEFLVIKNKYPAAPIHLLIVDKQHREKKETLVAGKYEGYWCRLFQAVRETVKKFNLDKTGYKLVNNGAGYNHFEHEHLHILGGSREEPCGQT